MNILLTGASGFLGSYVLRLLVKQGYYVSAVGDPERCRFSIESQSPLVQWFSSKNETLKAATHCTHALLIGSAIDMSGSTVGWGQCVETNVTEFSTLVNILAAHRCEKAVFTSSAGLYLRPVVKIPVKEDAMVSPLMPYWTTKLLAEQLLLSAPLRHQIHPVILRLSSPYGVHQKARSVLPFFISRALSGESITVKGLGARSQDFIHVEDAANAHVLSLLSQATTPGIYNLGSGEEMPMVELGRLALELAGRSPEEILHGETDGSDADRFCLDISLLRESTGFSPRSLRDGLLELF